MEAFLCFLAEQYISSSSCVSAAPALESTTPPKSLSSVYWRMVFRNQDLGSSCAHWDQNAVALSSFSGQRWETDVYMVTYAEAPIYISVYITCVYIFVCVGGAEYVKCVCMYVCKC